MHALIESTDSAFSEYWRRLAAGDPLQNPLYTPSRRQTADPAFTDRSFMVVAKDEPVFGCSLTLHTDDSGRRVLGYFGIEASTLVNRRSMSKRNNNFQPEAIRLLQEHFSQLIEELDPHAMDYLDPVSCGLMSPLTQVLLERGARPTIYRAQLIELSLSDRALLRLVSPTYRELISWGERNLDIDIVSGEQASAVSTRIPELLQNSSGALPATAAHWQACMELVEAGQGFLVQSRYEGLSPSTALFVHNDKTCHYVIDDARLDGNQRPVLHSMIWQALLHSKRLGCTQLDLGCIIEANKETDDERRVEPERFGGKPQTRLKVSLGQ